MSHCLQFEIKPNKDLSAKLLHTILEAYAESEGDFGINIYETGAVRFEIRPNDDSREAFKNSGLKQEDFYIYLNPSF